MLIIAGIVLFFVPTSQLVSGLRCGALFAGGLIIIAGFSYLNFCERIHDEAIDLFEKSKTEFVKTENKRMEKVKKMFPLYQMIYALFIIATLVVILFVNAPLWKGVSFAVTIFFLGIMIIEGFSYKSIKTYTKELKQELNK